MQQEIECRVESGDTSLVVFEDRAELNCVIKYLLDEFPSKAATKYAIGLRSPDDYKGVYEWRSSSVSSDVASITPKFENWANNAPTDKKCVTMTVGSGAAQNGKWQDEDCTQDNTLLAICERKI